MAAFLRGSLVALVLALMLASTPVAAQTDAAPAVETVAASEAPIPVAADARPGSSREVAIGSGIGSVIGVFLVLALLSSL